ncbi:MAG: hypothetical protein ACJAW0_000528 [Zhongshania sp.]|jgi:hypothetical protein
MLMCYNSHVGKDAISQSTYVWFFLYSMEVVNGFDAWQCSAG